MKIVIAPDSFKESLTAIEVANGIEQGFREIFPEATYIKIPVADGGEGTLQALIDAKQGTLIACEVEDPLGRIITAHYGLTPEGLAIIEMATASGLALLTTEERDPRITTSYGTGELIKDALNRGAKSIMLAIGGSATNDAGSGMLRALGARFLDQAGKEVEGGGIALKSVVKIDLSAFDTRIEDTHFLIACDVDNPLVGERGASAIFGPQKGATPEMVTALDEALTHFAKVTASTIGMDYADRLGAGAAGGLGFAALAYLAGELLPGIDLVMEIVELEKYLLEADLVITGEGKIDGQTIFGKTPKGVAQLAKRYHKPVIGIAGALGGDADAVYSHGIDAVFTITQRPEALEKALLESERNLVHTARNIAKLYQLAQMNASQ
ncbi:glycerate kinase [Ignatzschineria larvae DSM 13226]|uniref:Glycerate kinase n=1 Tax=Ignatzschineria larvae DSM 13226 TaxID=1111732 RepID=A0ABZ3BZ72_9GAMM|nr:glycerate kinase [Ignatzschineria larvae]